MSDRYILLWMTNLESVAVYSAGNKIGSFMLFLIYKKPTPLGP